MFIVSAYSSRIGESELVANIPDCNTINSNEIKFARKRGLFKNIQRNYGGTIKMNGEQRRWTGLPAYSNVDGMDRIEIGQKYKKQIAKQLTFIFNTF